MQIRHLTMALLIPMVLMGCTQRKTLYEVPSDRHEVRFSASGLEIFSQSKGALPDNQTILVAVYKGDDFVTQQTYNVTAGSMVPDNGKQIKLKAGTYDFYAYGPALSLNTANKIVAGITHGTDFLGASKLNQAISGSSVTVNLAFSHACSKVEFAVVPVNGMSVTGLSASKAKLSQMAVSPQRYELANSAIPAGSGSEVCTITGFTHAGDGKSSSGNMIVLPKSTGDFELEVEVELNGDPLTLTATVSNMAFVANDYYKFRALVGPNEVTLQLSVTVGDWNTVSDDEGLGAGWITIGTWTDVNWNGEMGGN